MRDLNNNSRKRKWGIWIIKEKNFWKKRIRHSGVKGPTECLVQSIKIIHILGYIQLRFQNNEDK